MLDRRGHRRTREQPEYLLLLFLPIAQSKNGHMMDCMSALALPCCTCNTCSARLYVSRVLYLAGPEDWQMVASRCSLHERRQCGEGNHCRFLRPNDVGLFGALNSWCRLPRSAADCDHHACRANPVSRRLENMFRDRRCAIDGSKT